MTTVRKLQFRVTCQGRNAKGHLRVMSLIAARSIVPNVTTTRVYPDGRVTLCVEINDSGIQAIQLARLFERLPTVLAVDLDINGKPVDFHEGAGKVR